MINDLAGVSYVLAKYLRKAGHEATVFSWMHDYFGFDKFYGGKVFQDPEIMKAVLAGIIPQYDIIHLHFPYTLLPWLYKFDKPIIFHAHGTEIATQTMDIRIAAQKAEGIIVAGEQLLQYHPRAQYLPTIVDTEHFYRRLPPQFRDPLIFDIPYLDTERAVKESGTNPHVVNRANAAMPYSELPTFLSFFDSYIDIRYHKQRGLLTDMSKTGLEALACGLKVYHMGEWKQGLSEQHKPELVVKKLLEYYEGVLN